jgi:predicted  nucleic acid-binding Zn-ribbon protein
MVDADSVLQNVQERDKWSRRMAVLEHALEEVRARRLRGESQLRRTRKEIGRLQATLDAVLDAARGQSNPGRSDATQRIPLTYR